MLELKVTVVFLRTKARGMTLLKSGPRAVGMFTNAVTPRSHVLSVVALSLSLFDSEKTLKLRKLRKCMFLVRKSHLSTRLHFDE